MGFDWFESDDSTPAGTAYTLTTTAGTPSAAIEVHAWLNKGSTVGSAETRYLRLEVEDGGVWKSSGLDTLDRREFEIRIVGSENPSSNPSFSVATTAWIPVGSRKTFPAVVWYPNCCVKFEVRVNPGLEGGSSSPATFRLRAVQGTGESPVSIPSEVSVDGDLDFGAHSLMNVVIGADSALGADLDAAGYTITTPVLSGASGTLGGMLDAALNRVANIPEPGLTTSAYDAANWGSVMQRGAKAPVKIICDANITLSGLQTIQGITLVENSSVLLTTQTDPAENGKWLAHAGAWERHPDCLDGYFVYAGITVYCRAGTYARQVWIQTSDDPAAQVWEPLVALP